ncbi:hypothetical protein E2542_SST21292 [Spatholobus suberectus]|nr:hypothetical protein E2542_SST21292 [Spatholobus suberectus]
MNCREMNTPNTHLFSFHPLQRGCCNPTVHSSFDGFGMASHYSSRCSLCCPYVDSPATVTQPLHSHRHLPCNSIASPWCTRRRRAVPADRPHITSLSTTAY